MTRHKTVHFFLRFLPFLFALLLLAFLLLPTAVTVKLTHIFFSLAFLLLFIIIVLATFASPPPRGLLVKVKDGGDGEQYFYPGVPNLFYLLPDRRPPEVISDENIRHYPVPLIEITSIEDEREVRFRLMQGIVCRHEKVASWGEYVEFSETESCDAHMGCLVWKLKLMEL